MNAVNRAVAILAVQALCGLSCASGSTTGRTAGGTEMAGAAASTEIAEQQAIAVAEQFVADNGYTDLPPKEGREISRESIDDSDPKERARARANSLKRRACAVASENVWTDEAGWSVVFCYNPDFARGDPEMSAAMRTRGRVVVMSRAGTDLRMLHMEVVLGASGLRELK